MKLRFRLGYSISLLGGSLSFGILLAMDNFGIELLLFCITAFCTYFVASLADDNLIPKLIKDLKKKGWLK